jgi:hypothetical protein
VRGTARPARVSTAPAQWFLIPPRVPGGGGVTCLSEAEPAYNHVLYLALRPTRTPHTWVSAPDDSQGASGSPALGCRQRTLYGDEKVANRDIRVWHGATENGP